MGKKRIPGVFYDENGEALDDYVYGYSPEDFINRRKEREENARAEYKRDVLGSPDVKEWNDTYKSWEAKKSHFSDIDPSKEEWQELIGRMGYQKAKEYSKHLRDTYAVAKRNNAISYEDFDNHSLFDSKLKERLTERGYSDEEADAVLQKKKGELVGVRGMEVALYELKQRKSEELKRYLDDTGYVKRGRYGYQKRAEQQPAQGSSEQAEDPQQEEKGWFSKAADHMWNSAVNTLGYGTAVGGIASDFQSRVDASTERRQRDWTAVQNDVMAFDKKYKLKEKRDPTAALNEAASWAETLKNSPEYQKADARKKEAIEAMIAKGEAAREIAQLEAQPPVKLTEDGKSIEITDDKYPDKVQAVMSRYLRASSILKGEQSSDDHIYDWVYSRSGVSGVTSSLRNVWENVSSVLGFGKDRGDIYGESSEDYANEKVQRAMDFGNLVDDIKHRGKTQERLERFDMDAPGNTMASVLGQVKQGAVGWLADPLLESAWKLGLPVPRSIDHIPMTPFEVGNRSAEWIKSADKMDLTTFITRGAAGLLDAEYVNSEKYIQLLRESGVIDDGTEESLHNVGVAITGSVANLAASIFTPTGAMGVSGKVMANAAKGAVAAGSKLPFAGKSIANFANHSKFYSNFINAESHTSRLMRAVEEGGEKVNKVIGGTDGFKRFQLVNKIINGGIEVPFADAARLGTQFSLAHILEDVDTGVVSDDSILEGMRNGALFGFTGAVFAQAFGRAGARAFAVSKKTGYNFDPSKLIKQAQIGKVIGDAVANPLQTFATKYIDNNFITPENLADFRDVTTDVVFGLLFAGRDLQQQFRNSKLPAHQEFMRETEAAYARSGIDGWTSRVLEINQSIRKVEEAEFDFIANAGKEAAADQPPSSGKPPAPKGNVDRPLPGSLPEDKDTYKSVLEWGFLRKVGEKEYNGSHLAKFLDANGDNRFEKMSAALKGVKVEFQVGTVSAPRFIPPTGEHDGLIILPLHGRYRGAIAEELAHAIGYKAIEGNPTLRESLAKEAFGVFQFVNENPAARQEALDKFLESRKVNFPKESPEFAVKVFGDMAKYYLAKKPYKRNANDRLHEYFAGAFNDASPLPFIIQAARDRGFKMPILTDRLAAIAGYQDLASQELHVEPEIPRPEAKGKAKSEAAPGPAPKAPPEPTPKPTPEPAPKAEPEAPSAAEAMARERMQNFIRRAEEKKKKISDTDGSFPNDLDEYGLGAHMAVVADIASITGTAPEEIYQAAEDQLGGMAKEKMMALDGKANMSEDPELMSKSISKAIDSLAAEGRTPDTDFDEFLTRLDKEIVGQVNNERRALRGEGYQGDFIDVGESESSKFVGEIAAIHSLESTNGVTPFLIDRMQQRVALAETPEDGYEGFKKDILERAETFFKADTERDFKQSRVDDFEVDLNKFIQRNHDLVSTKKKHYSKGYNAEPVAPDKIPEKRTVRAAFRDIANSSSDLLAALAAGRSRDSLFGEKSPSPHEILLNLLADPDASSENDPFFMPVSSDIERSIDTGATGLEQMIHAASKDGLISAGNAHEGVKGKDSKGEAFMNIAKARRRVNNLLGKSFVSNDLSRAKTVEEGKAVSLRILKDIKNIFEEGEEFMWWRALNSDSMWKVGEKVPTIAKMAQHFNIGKMLASPIGSDPIGWSKHEDGSPSQANLRKILEIKGSRESLDAVHRKLHEIHGSWKDHAGIKDFWSLHNGVEESIKNGDTVPEQSRFRDFAENALNNQAGALFTMMMDNGMSSWKLKRSESPDGSVDAKLGKWLTKYVNGHYSGGYIQMKDVHAWRAAQPAPMKQVSEEMFDEVYGTHTLSDGSKGHINVVLDVESLPDGKLKEALSSFMESDTDGASFFVDPRAHKYYAEYYNAPNGGSLKDALAQQKNGNFMFSKGMVHDHWMNLPPEHPIGALMESLRAKGVGVLRLGSNIKGDGNYRYGEAGDILYNSKRVPVGIKEQGKTRALEPEEVEAMMQWTLNPEASLPEWAKVEVPLYGDQAARIEQMRKGPSDKGVMFPAAGLVHSAGKTPYGEMIRRYSKALGRNIGESVKELVLGKRYISSADIEAQGEGAKFLDRVAEALEKREVSSDPFTSYYPEMQASVMLRRAYDIEKGTVDRDKVTALEALPGLLRGRDSVMEHAIGKELKRMQRLTVPAVYSTLKPDGAAGHQHKSMRDYETNRIEKDFEKKAARLADPAKKSKEEFSIQEEMAYRGLQWSKELRPEENLAILKDNVLTDLDSWYLEAAEQADTYRDEKQTHYADGSLMRSVGRSEYDLLYRKMREKNPYSRSLLMYKVASGMIPPDSPEAVAPAMIWGLIDSNEGITGPSDFYQKVLGSDYDGDSRALLLEDKVYDSGNTSFLKMWDEHYEMGAHKGLFKGDRQDKYLSGVTKSIGNGRTMLNKMLLTAGGSEAKPSPVRHAPWHRGAGGGYWGAASKMDGSVGASVGIMRDFSLALQEARQYAGTLGMDVSENVGLMEARKNRFKAPNVLYKNGDNLNFYVNFPKYLGGGTKGFAVGSHPDLEAVAMVSKQLGGVDKYQVTTVDFEDYIPRSFLAPHDGDKTVSGNEMKYALMQFNKEFRPPWGSEYAETPAGQGELEENRKHMTAYAGRALRAGAASGVGEAFMAATDPIANPTKDGDKVWDSKRLHELGYQRFAKDYVQAVDKTKYKTYSTMAEKFFKTNSFYRLLTDPHQKWQHLASFDRMKLEAQSKEERVIAMAALRETFLSGKPIAFRSPNIKGIDGELAGEKFGGEKPVIALVDRESKGIPMLRIDTKTGHKHFHLHETIDLGSRNVAKYIEESIDENGEPVTKSKMGRTYLSRPVIEALRQANTGEESVSSSQLANAVYSVLSYRRGRDGATSGGAAYFDKANAYKGEARAVSAGRLIADIAIAMEPSKRDKDGELITANKIAGAFLASSLDYAPSARPDAMDTFSIEGTPLNATTKINDVQALSLNPFYIMTGMTAKHVKPLTHDGKHVAHELLRTIEAVAKEDRETPEAVEPTTANDRGLDDDIGFGANINTIAGVLQREAHNGKTHKNHDKIFKGMNEEGAKRLRQVYNEALQEFRARFPDANTPEARLAAVQVAQGLKTARTSIEGASKEGWRESLYRATKALHPKNRTSAMDLAATSGEDPKFFPAETIVSKDVAVYRAEDGEPSAFMNPTKVGNQLDYATGNLNVLGIIRSARAMLVEGTHKAVTHLKTVAELVSIQAEKIGDLGYEAQTMLDKMNVEEAFEYRAKLEKELEDLTASRDLLSKELTPEQQKDFDKRVMDARKHDAPGKGLIALFGSNTTKKKEYIEKRFNPETDVVASYADAYKMFEKEPDFMALPREVRNESVFRAVNADIEHYIAEGKRVYYIAAGDGKGVREFSDKFKPTRIGFLGASEQDIVRHKGERRRRREAAVLKHDAGLHAMAEEFLGSDNPFIWAHEVDSFVEMAYASGKDVLPKGEDDAEKQLNFERRKEMALAAREDRYQELTLLAAEHIDYAPKISISNYKSDGLSVEAGLKIDFGHGDVLEIKDETDYVALERMLFGGRNEALSLSTKGRFEDAGLGTPTNIEERKSMASFIKYMHQNVKMAANEMSLAITLGEHLNKVAAGGKIPSQMYEAYNAAVEAMMNRSAYLLTGGAKEHYAKLVMPSDKTEALAWYHEPLFALMRSGAVSAEDKGGVRIWSVNQDMLDDENANADDVAMLDRMGKAIGYKPSSSSGAYNQLDYAAIVKQYSIYGSAFKSNELLSSMVEALRTKYDEPLDTTAEMLEKEAMAAEAVRIGFAMSDGALAVRGLNHYSEDIARDMKRRANAGMLTAEKIMTGLYMLDPYRDKFHHKNMLMAINTFSNERRTMSKKIDPSDMRSVHKGNFLTGMAYIGGKALPLSGRFVGESTIEKTRELPLNILLKEWEAKQEEEEANRQSRRAPAREGFSEYAKKHKTIKEKVRAVVLYDPASERFIIAEQNKIISLQGAEDTKRWYEFVDENTIEERYQQHPKIQSLANKVAEIASKKDKTQAMEDSMALAGDSVSLADLEDQEGVRQTLQEIAQFGYASGGVMAYGGGSAVLKGTVAGLGTAMTAIGIGGVAGAAAFPAALAAGSLVTAGSLGARVLTKVAGNMLSAYRGTALEATNPFQIIRYFTNTARMVMDNTRKGQAQSMEDNRLSRVQDATTALRLQSGYTPLGDQEEVAKSMDTVKRLLSVVHGGTTSKVEKWNKLLEYAAAPSQALTKIHQMSRTAKAMDAIEAEAGKLVKSLEKIDTVFLGQELHETLGKYARSPQMKEALSSGYRVYSTQKGIKVVDSQGRTADDIRTLLPSALGFVSSLLGMELMAVSEISGVKAGTRSEMYNHIKYSDADFAKRSLGEQRSVMEHRMTKLMGLYERNLYTAQKPFRLLEMYRHWGKEYRAHKTWHRVAQWQQWSALYNDEFFDQRGGIKSWVKDLAGLSPAAADRIEADIRAGKGLTRKIKVQNTPAVVAKDLAVAGAAKFAASTLIGAAMAGSIAAFSSNAAGQVLETLGLDDDDLIANFAAVIASITINSEGVQRKAFDNLTSAADMATGGGMGIKGMEGLAIGSSMLLAHRGGKGKQKQDKLKKQVTRSMMNSVSVFLPPTAGATGAANAIREGIEQIPSTKSLKKAFDN